MATITLRPTSASGTSWSNIANAYDGNKSTCASVSASRFNYSSRTLSLNFDTSVIPSGATINSATLTLRSKAGKNTITAYADINGDSQYRVINQKQSTTITNYTANITSYMSELSTIVVRPYNSNYSGNTFELYELWIDVDYTVSTTYTVRFLDWDNSVISTQTVTSGGSATPPPNPTRDGYTFTGWLGDYTNVTSDVDIIAQYVQSTNQNTTIILSNYSPNGEEFRYYADIDFANGDYVEANMDLTNCSPDTDEENILSVGVDIHDFSSSIAYHVYYHAANKSINLWSYNVTNGTNKGYTYDASSLDITNVTIKIDKTGMYINNKLITDEEIDQLNSTLCGKPTFEIGSMEGTTRSNAFYRYVKVVKCSSSGGGGGSISGKVFDIYMKDINIGDTTVTDNTTGVTLDILGTDWTKNGDGIVFGANSAIRYNNGLFDSIGEACTIMLEVEVPDSSSASDLEYLFYWGDDYWENEYGFYMCASSRGFEICENSSYEFIRLSTDSLSTRDMYFITYDSTDATIKKQTTTLGTKSLPMSTLPTPATVVFGNTTSLGYAMNGTMYRIAVFNKVLNDDEIADFVSGVSGTKNIKIGSSTIDKLYLGTSQILKVYLGDTLLYS